MNIGYIEWSSSFVIWRYRINWWFFTECTEYEYTGSIYGYIKHTYEWVDYEMWAWINYNFPSWNPIATWSGSLKRITVPNNTAAGYIFDNHGWTAKVISSMWFFARAEFGEWVEWEHESSQIATWYNIVIDLFSNKNASYEITWDISTSPITGTLTGNEGNIRDYTRLEQLVVLSNIESINALLIRQGLTQNERLFLLNKTAITQMKSLLESNAMKKLK